MKIAIMVSKWDYQITFGCGAKFIPKNGQNYYFEAKCAESRVVQKCGITLQKQPTHQLPSIVTKIKRPPPPLHDAVCEWSPFKGNDKNGHTLSIMQPYGSSCNLCK